MRWQPSWDQDPAVRFLSPRLWHGASSPLSKKISLWAKSVEEPGEEGGAPQNGSEKGAGGPRPSRLDRRSQWGELRSATWDGGSPGDRGSDAGF